MVMNLLVNAGGTRDVDLIPRLGRSLEREMATHSSILVWEILRTEEPDGLQPMGLQRAGHDRATEHTHTHTHIIQKDTCTLTFIAAVVNNSQDMEATSM